jgi:RNA polymerase sigma-70 factor (ECF subfamily)
MTEPAASTPVHTPNPKGSGASGSDFVDTFNAVRTELVSTLYFVLGNYDDAQDAAQEAFIKCWRASDSISDVRNMRAWIFRVGINSAKDLQRNAWRRRARPLASSAMLIETNGASPTQTLQDQETQERLRQALLALRPEEKEIFLLRQNGCLTYEEIARLRQAPVGTVKTQMRAALIKLRQVFQGSHDL